MKSLHAISILICILLSILTTAQNNNIDFDGTDDYIEIDDLTESTEGTIELWILPDATVAENPVFGNGNIAALSMAIRVTSDYKVRFSVRDNVDWVEVYGNTGSISTSQYTHIAVTWNASSANIYVNGVLENSGLLQSAPIAATGNWQLGGSTISGAMDYFSGTIDEVRFWNDIRTSDEIRQNMFQELSNPVSEGNLVAYYKLNESDGTSTATDSKNSYDGTLTDMTGNEWETSPAFFGPKNCLDFDGTDDYVSLTNSSLLKPANALTFECWIYPDNWSGPAYPNHDVFAGNTQTGGYNFAQGYPSASHIGFAVYTGGDYQRVDADLTGYTGWHHVAGTFDGQYVQLYIDGELKDELDMGSSGNTITYDNDNCTILGEEAGGECIPSGYNYTGLMDEVRFWNVARTEEQIQENMCRSLTGTETGLVAYYNFDNNAETTLQDFTTNKIDGTLNGMDNTDWTASSAFNTWLNTSTTSWNTTTNWSLGSIPNSSSTNVGIPDHGTAFNPDASSGISINNLAVCDDAELTYSAGSHVIHGNVYNFGTTNINDDDLTITGSLYMLSGSTLNVNPGGAVTVERNLYNRTGLFGHATLNINSSASGTGSMIVEGSITNDGNMNCQRYIDDWNTGDGWHFLSSPVDDQSISPDFVNISGTISESVDFYKWSEPLDLWINIKKEDGTYNQGSEPTNFSAEADPEFGVGLGYLVAYESDVTKTFSGTFNNISPSKTALSYTSESTHTGAHLLGNPFPSALRWNQTTGESGWDLDNINGTAKIWSSANASYTDITQGDAIPAMQGFMVLVSTEGTGSLNIFKGDRIHSEQGWYKAVETNKLKLIAHDPEGGKAQESILMAKDNATNDFDHQYDSPFYAGYAPLFYSWINQKPASTNAIPSFDENLTIPFAFVKNESSEFYISIEGAENFVPEREVYLIDYQLDKTHNLSLNPSYFFTSAEADDPNRFAITFKAVGIDDPDPATTSQLPIHCWNSQQTITISNPEQLTGTVEVISMTSQILLTGNLENATKQTIKHHLTPGIYVVRINAGNKMKNQKIVIR
jgi:hypothetical protein